MTRGIRGSSTVHRTLNYWHRKEWHSVEITAQSRTGAAYIDLTFDRAPTPLEVINIFDYVKGESRLKNHGDPLEPLVDDWIALRDQEEIESYEDDTPLRRDWLRNYVENNRF